MSLEGLEVVVLAAGKGVRMRSAKPKVLHTVCGRTLLDRVIRAAAALKPRKISVVVGHGREDVESELAALRGRLGFAADALTSVLQEQQLGTGHAVQVALPEVSQAKHILILPGDVPLLTAGCLEKLVSLYKAGQQNGVSFLSFEPPVVSGFGRVVRDARGQVQAVVEEKDASAEQREIAEVNASIYLVSAGFLAHALRSMSSDNAQGEYYLTDIVAKGVSEKVDVQAILSDDYRDVTGANSRGELSCLESIQRGRIAARLMAEGVYLEDPMTTYIEDDVQIGIDTSIGAGVHIKGNSVIGANVTIEPACHITDSRIANGCAVKYASVLEDAQLASSCQIGPFARLRPGTELGDGVRIGNFVETKKSVFGAGAKANHLSYVGDAQVGRNVNIGAGTITCNYDGVSKFKTELDDGVFIGS
ncbi:MAG: bifunctional UDP-N-acetylglucosamine diphosphorylase/glucosamine-1-phosphate N-acetyltransferase GlmU, partial [Bdellovibrionales bacterium]|nr:bifunctional UDP-N-acetylglucosamine diphosphorylase/glucosamine-1-phosphate N-acetyltransferase GlmU [Bdellovibrionales bacterium]